MHARMYQSNPGRGARRGPLHAHRTQGDLRKDLNEKDACCGLQIMDACIYHRLSIYTSIHKICGVCFTNVRTSYSCCMYVYTHIIQFHLHLFKIVHMHHRKHLFDHLVCTEPPVAIHLSRAHNAQASHISGTIPFPRS